MMRVDSETYYGSPCRKCEGTKRYRSSGNCVACVSKRSRDRGGREERTRQKPAEKPRSIFDPTNGGAFADSIRDRLRAGR